MNEISQTAEQTGAQVILLSAYRRALSQDDGPPPPSPTPLAARRLVVPITLDVVAKDEQRVPRSARRSLRRAVCAPG